ncbi:MAG: ABC transporter permease [Anaerolineaceae bacterium]|nr:ABC transporter permease [Anaerolineaceae bacterium]
MQSKSRTPEQQTTASRRNILRPGRLHYGWYVPYLFVLPGLLLYVLWMLYPMFYQFYISFFDWKIMPGQVSEFVGLANYERALADSKFWLALGNTVRYTAVTVVGQMLIGLTIAILVHRVVVGKRVFRAIYYLPVVTSWVVVSFLFQYIFNSGRAGLINYLLLDVLHLISEPISWVQRPETAWIIIYSLGIWKGVGWAMIIYLAALQGIPREIYEAAAIDGADLWRQLRHITLPLIQRTSLFVLVALVIGGFQVFISVFLITGGGPLGRTEVSLSYMYNQSFNKLQFGYGAALSYILALIIVVVSFLQMRVFRGPEVEY